MTSVLDTQNPLLWRACLAGEVTAMDRVMDKGADPHKTDRNGENCLHMCARSGEVSAMERMVQIGLTLNQANHNGQTPLHVAVTKRHMGVVRFIVRQGADTDLKSKFSGMTALHLSCVDNEVDIVQFLLDNGADCAIQDTIGKYADDYTKDQSILDVFEAHFPECTHGRKTQEQIRGKNLRQESDVVYIIDEALRQDNTSQQRYRTKSDDDEDDDDDESTREQRLRQKRERGELNDRNRIEIYDKMEHYDVDRARQNWEKAKRKGKKIKINHALGFSDEHKQRMATNVFDRLMKKK